MCRKLVFLCIRTESSSWLQTMGENVAMPPLAAAMDLLRKLPQSWSVQEQHDQSAFEAVAAALGCHEGHMRPVTGIK